MFSFDTTDLAETPDAPCGAGFVHETISMTIAAPAEITDTTVALAVQLRPGTDENERIEGEDSKRPSPAVAVVPPANGQSVATSTHLDETEPVAEPGPSYNIRWQDEERAKFRLRLAELHRYMTVISRSRC